MGQISVFPAMPLICTMSKEQLVQEEEWKIPAGNLSAPSTMQDATIAIELTMAWMNHSTGRALIPTQHRDQGHIMQQATVLKMEAIVH